MDFTERKN